MNGISTEYIPMYDGGVRVYGMEPDGLPVPTPTKTPDPSPTPTKEPNLVKLGDINYDGTVDSIDSTLLSRYIFEVLTYTDPSPKNPLLQQLT